MAEPMSAQDKVDIMELISSYAVALDTADLEMYLANFAEDGELDRPPRPVGGGLVHGQKELREVVAGLIRDGKVGLDHKILHFMGLPQISGNSERCTAQTYLALYMEDANGSPNLPAVGRYSDVCVKKDGKWQFERRHLRYIVGAN